MNQIVNTPCGPIQGVPGRVPGTVAYKGIRYATAGRWEYPRQVTAWEGVYDASHYGHCSYQPRAFYDEELNKKKYFYYNEFRKGVAYTYSEDCLYLNVFTPETASAGQNLPVIVYIHGGGYTGGCGHEKHFDGPVWPLSGVIAVTINYRLGPMGFVYLPELVDEAGHAGNYALYDQMTAIQWVKDNIASFGGDPANITIMGQSAGAMSVQFHCESPLTEGLFQKAVMSSGCGMGGMMASSPEKAAAFWQAVMARCGCATLDEFRKVSPEKLFTVWQQAKKEVKGGATSASPVKDGVFIPEKSTPRAIPYMAGSTSQDMAPPVMFHMAKAWCAKAQRPSFAWYFDRQLPGDNCGAWHSSDLWYWFGTLPNCWRSMAKKDYDLSAQMVQYLCSFAASGIPSGVGYPVWKPTGKQAMLLGEKPSRMDNPSLAKMVATMLTNKAVGE